MKPLAQLDKVTILSEDVFKEIFEDEDEIHKARLILSLEERAEELGVKGKFTRLLSAYKKSRCRDQEGGQEEPGGISGG